MAASSPKRTVKWNYTADKSFMFLGTDEMEHLPKPANTAYMVINGSRLYTSSSKHGTGGEATHTHSRWNPSISADTQKAGRLSDCSRWNYFKARYISCWKFLTFHDGILTATAARNLGLCWRAERDCARAALLSAEAGRTQLQSEGKIKVFQRQWGLWPWAPPKGALTSKPHRAPGAHTQDATGSCYFRILVQQLDKTVLILCGPQAIADTFSVQMSLALKYTHYVLTCNLHFKDL